MIGHHTISCPWGAYNKGLLLQTANRRISLQARPLPCSKQQQGQKINDLPLAGEEGEAVRVLSPDRSVAFPGPGLTHTVRPRLVQPRGRRPPGLTAALPTLSHHTPQGLCDTAGIEVVKPARSCTAAATAAAGQQPPAAAAFGSSAAASQQHTPPNRVSSGSSR